MFRLQKDVNPVQYYYLITVKCSSNEYYAFQMAKHQLHLLTCYK